MGRPKKNYTPREQKEARIFQCIIYEDGLSPEQLQCKLNRLSFYWDKFYYIRHDRDSYNEHDYDRWNAEHPDSACPFNIGDSKKTHYHCIGVSSPSLLGRAATKFDVPSNLVQTVSKFKEAVQYLIHLNNPEKFQYQKEEIITNDPDIEEILKMKISPSFKAKMLIDYIDSKPFITFADLSVYAIQNDLWDELRRGQHIFSSLVIEHNKIGVIAK